MKIIGMKASLSLVLMIIFLIIALITKDVVISQLFAILGIFTGCFCIQICIKPKHNKA